MSDSGASVSLSQVEPENLVDARVSPLGSLENLSQREVDKLLTAGHGGVYDLFRRCALAVIGRNPITARRRSVLLLLVDIVRILAKPPTTCGDVPRVLANLRIRPRPCQSADHSRSASVGWTPAARRAGIQLARITAAVSSTTIATNTAGSDGSTAKSSD